MNLVKIKSFDLVFKIKRIVPLSCLQNRMKQHSYALIDCCHFFVHEHSDPGQPG